MGLAVLYMLSSQEGVALNMYIVLEIGREYGGANDHKTTSWIQLLVTNIVRVTHRSLVLLMTSMIVGRGSTWQIHGVPAQGAAYSRLHNYAGFSYGRSTRTF